MTNDRTPKRTPLLDPIQLVSEIVFGVLMALSFTGALSVASAGHEEVRTMMHAALGCNLAWGLTDAVIYLFSTVTERQRNVTLLQSLQETQDAGIAQQLIADALPERIAAGATPAELDAIRQRLLKVTVPRPALGPRDFLGALGVFVLVVLATFPVVIPFMLLDEATLALRMSNLLAVATLFVSGRALGRHAGGSPWRYGLALSAIGVVLVGIIVALGG